MNPLDVIAIKECPNGDQLRRLLCEELSVDEQTTVLEHVETCPDCLAQLERLTPSDDFSWISGDSVGNRQSATTRSHTIANEAVGLVTIPDFEIEAQIGRGGHGVVFRAKQLSLGRTVALKVLRKGVFATADEVARFLFEAGSAARLTHQGIVQIFALGNSDGVPWFAMELLEGGTLSDRTRGVPVPAKMAAQLVGRLARAEAHAHENGVVHRDLKPGNILFAGRPLVQSDSEEPPRWSQDEIVKIADFGLAKQLDGDDGQTPTVAILGTPSYMAPEQALGGTKGATTSTDIYSLGAVLYELLTGRAPFRAETPFETLMQVRDAEPVSPRQLQPRVPLDLEVICLKCLEKRPERRYATAALLAEDLERFQAGLPIVARPPGWLERGVKWCRRNPWRAVAGGLAGVTVLAGALFFWQTERKWSEGRAQALLRSLPTINEAGLPDLIGQLGEVREFANPQLQSIADSEQMAPAQRLRAMLALLPAAPERTDAVYGKIDDATVGELLVMQTLLIPHAQRLAPRLWADVERKPHLSAAKVTRRASLLAALAPDDNRWIALGPMVADFVVTENPLVVRDWQESFSNVRWALTPRLREIHRDPKAAASERLLASTLLAEYFDTDPKQIADLIQVADRQQFDVLLPLLRLDEQTAKPILREVLKETSLPTADDVQRDALARRRSRAAVALIHLGEYDVLDRMLTNEDLRERGKRDYPSGDSLLPPVELEDEPRATSYLIHDLARYDVPASRVIDALRRCDRPEVRYALLLALGEYSEVQLPIELRADLFDDLESAYAADPDSGVHGALTWLLGQRWGRAERIAAFDQELRRNLPQDRFDWFVDRSGRTFTVFRGPIETLVGSPPGERHRVAPDEALQYVKIDYDFAIATREETAGDFADAAGQLDVYFRAMAAPHESIDFLDRREPARNVGWLQAVVFARWLSEREGFSKSGDDDTCYPPLDQCGPNMVLRSGFLTRPGYRLATRFEWEHACRAGTRTPRFYGYDRQMMDGYSWSLQNADDRPGLVGSLKPNAFGLFDMLGNVWEHSSDCRLIPQGTIMNAVESNLTDHVQQYARGGSYLYHAPFIRSAANYRVSPAGRDFTLGFRLVRTLGRRQ